MVSRANRLTLAKERKKRLCIAGEACLLKPMGHCKGKDNVKKHAARRKKTERLALAKTKALAAAK